MSEAVQKFVHDEDLFYMGGFACRIIYSAIHEMVRQHKKDLIVCGAGGCAEEGDVAVAAGCVKKMMCPYWGLFEVGLSRVATRAINNGQVHVDDYTNLGAPFRVLAGAIGAPYVPVKEAFGSDLLKYADPNEAKVSEDPFTGEKVVLYRALNPDSCVVHAQQADEYGNTQLFGLIAADDWGARASDRVIVVVEKIVSREEIGSDPNRTLIPGDFVSAVVHEPYAAHPSGVTGYYKEDIEFRRMYASMAKTEEGLRTFMDEWIYSIPDRETYIEKYVKKFGRERLDALRVKPLLTPPVNIGAY